MLTAAAKETLLKGFICGAQAVPNARYESGPFLAINAKSNSTKSAWA